MKAWNSSEAPRNDASSYSRYILVPLLLLLLSFYLKSSENVLFITWVIRLYGSESLPSEQNEVLSSSWQREKKVISSYRKIEGIRGHSKEANKLSQVKCFGAGVIFNAFGSHSSSSILSWNSGALAVTRLLTEPCRAVSKASQWYSSCFSVEVFKRHHPLSGRVSVFIHWEPDNSPVGTVPCALHSLWCSWQDIFLLELSVARNQNTL